MKKTAAEVVEAQAGTNAKIVWVFLQDESTRGNAGPKGALLKSLKEVANGTGLNGNETQTAIIELATRNLVSRVTADGRVAA